jgi:glycosyltransferase involved in cell wall biosynthesis
MRILALSNLFPPDVIGGYELLARDVVLALRARGHDVEVVTTGEARPSDPPWVRRALSLTRPFGEPGALDRGRHLVAALEQRAAMDVVLGEPFDAALLFSLRRLGLHAPRALARHGVPHVYLFNDDYLLAHRPGAGANAITRGLWSAVERGPFAARTWDGVRFERAIYVSASTRQQLQDGGAPVPEGRVCWQGVDRAMFARRAPRPVPARPALLYTGRVHPTKGVDLAIRALGELRRGGLEATLRIAGTGADAELARLRAIAEEERVAAHVEWLGFVPRDRLGDVYRAADVFVFPSTWQEPAGLTYLEAMSCGVPVVAIARGGAVELLSHEENCLVADDSRGIADGVRRLVAEPDLAERVVAGGEITVRERATLDRYVDVIEAELAEAAGMSRANSPRDAAALTRAPAPTVV